MILRGLEKVYGTAAVLAHLPGQYGAAYAPAEALRSRRDARVHSLVRYAAETVPHWRDLFRKLRLDPRDIRSAEDLSSLPLLEKAAVRRDPERFLSSSRRARGAARLVTSGTTGEPLAIHHDRHSLFANLAYRERERQVVRKVLGRWSGYRVAALTYSRSIARSVSESYRAKTVIPFRPTEIWLPIEDALDRILAALNEFRPDVLSGYGGYLETLFRVVAAKGLRLHRPRLAIYGASAMTDPGRKLIEEEFGIPVFSWYNAAEAFKIGFTCEERQGYHLHSDLCHLRVVRSDGSPASEDEEGEIVISNLVNHGTVLLNYKLGDVGAVSSRRCPCGRSLPLLSRLVGRVEDCLLLPGGRVVDPRAIWGVFKARPEILRYQLVQMDRERFALRLRTLDRDLYEKALPSILSEICGLLGAVSVEPFLDEALGEGTAKFRPVISLGLGDA